VKWNKIGACEEVMRWFLNISHFTNLFTGSKRMLLPRQSRSILVSVEEGCRRIYPDLSV